MDQRYLSEVAYTKDQQCHYMAHPLVHTTILCTPEALQKQWHDTASILEKCHSLLTISIPTFNIMTNQSPSEVLSLGWRLYGYEMFGNGKRLIWILRLSELSRKRRPPTWSIDEIVWKIFKLMSCRIYYIKNIIIMATTNYTSIKRRMDGDDDCGGYLSKAFPEVK